MYFTQEDINQLMSDYKSVEDAYKHIFNIFFARPYKDKCAEEYVFHGFLRRVKNIKRCIDNVYDICPPDTSDKLTSEDLSDLDINLQSFVLNVYGCLDNLAWIWVAEKGIVDKKGMPLKKSHIGFNKKIVRDSFSKGVLELILTDRYQKWLEYLEDFRHSLAHRIPLYVPPYVLDKEEILKNAQLESEIQSALGDHQFEAYQRLRDEQESLGSFIPWIMHSFGENSPQVIFHAQILADWNSLKEISEKLLKDLDD